MNNTDYKRPLIVGIFIFTGLVIFIIGVFAIGSQQKIFEKKINLKIIFDDVSGLQAGNNVWLSGVKVGTVKKISFYGSTQVEITMNIERSFQSHIYRNAKGQDKY
jgi:phospholipid/cholesterol/gamma-HCH transport system substrate-binding protein